MTTEPKDLLLLVWVHGFKGNDVTFESFPDRICHLLRTTHESLRVESRVFPMYQTRGELHAATLAFVDWLTELVVNLENDHGQGGGAGKAKIVLMGHSMGGLLCADTLRDIARNTREEDPMWPKVVGILAFDTPYLGLHPHTFKHHISQAATYFDHARSIASAATMLSPVASSLGWNMFGKKSDASANSSNAQASSSKGKSRSTTVTETSEQSAEKSAASNTFWSGLSQVSSGKKMYGLGAAALGAAAMGAAYYRREDFVTGWKWGYEHMTFVKNLWDSEGMTTRLEAVDGLIKERGLLFSNYYSHLPPNPPDHLVARTFSILPPTNHPLYPYFRPASNTLAKDEVSAHMGMFNPKTNDGFYDLGLAVVKEIGERIEREGVGRKEGIVEEELGAGEEREATGEKDNQKDEGIWRVEKDENGKEVWVET
ncbi:hypothetical protein L202_03636 [Cryptococcus amylolentus CBS 6039]|uniref:DUF676 domain-containing protein n=2 Tax=Cryptococcus amylolentus TaxID=104669 RepID=A0A1E3HTS2_9TREE|nr:hypothetical protein L202_03636 [Cryptococcus amylolentus CBS 6039]ODN79712.1 hypothetical protein L202_03636 [Cryptococcus amylolentus CBS 6039]ODO08012.1 hypothetical protein I350_03595 [Cryptococcus amylolentus CBS 6273]